MKRFTVISVLSTAFVLGAGIAPTVASAQLAQEGEFGTAVSPSAHTSTVTHSNWNHDQSGVVARGAVATPVALSPDRADGLGSARLPTEPAPVIVHTTTSGGFDWADAAAGLALGLLLAAIAGAGMMTRGKRRLALPS